MDTLALLLIVGLAVSPAFGQAHDDTTAATSSIAATPVDHFWMRAGGFTYDFSIPGWPSGFSYRGLSPNDLAVRFGDIRMDDPFSGRPRLDLVPTQLTSIPALAVSPFGSPYVAEFNPRNFLEPQALTEATYWSSNAGLQSVRVFHRQQRIFRRSTAPVDSVAAAADSAVVVSNRTTKLQATFSYHGIAAQGEYPGSRVRRGRQVAASVGLSGARWSATLSELYNGRSVGAHEGVNPPIYRRLGATVRQADAQRVTRRNDLGLVATYRFYGEPMRLGAVWTQATERYTTGADTVEARSRRLSWSLSQRLLRSVPVSILLDGNHDSMTGSRGLTDGPADGTTSYLFVGVGGETSWGAARIGLVQSAGTTSFAGSLHGDVRISAIELRATASTTPQRRSLIDVIGFSDFVAPLPRDDERARYTTASLGLTLRVRSLSLGLEGFATLATNAHVYFATSDPDSIVAARVAGTTVATGASAVVGLREEARRGFYTRVRLDAYDAGTLPDFYATGQLGYRRSLFQGDLVGDFAVRGRAWPDFRGRSLHPQTGLLVIAPADNLVPASWVVDVVVTTKVRTASIFVLYENLFSGTQLLEGNQLIVGYPLEQQRFRFGVWWPIKG